MFFIRVSLQGQKAQLLFQRLLALCGLGCLQMIDATLRRERLEPQPFGKADSQPERSSQSLLTSSGPHLRGLTPLQWHAKAKAWKLRNQGCNSCYANALTLCLLWLEGYSNIGILQGPVGNSLRSLMQGGTPTDLWSIMSWVSATRGWDPTPATT